jgi:mannose-6-phosphate isomerase-like protein (cupin superfamily)
VRLLARSRIADLTVHAEVVAEPVVRAVLVVEEGSGEAVVDGVRTAIQAGFAVVVPAGAKHNIINTGSVALKLYTLYAPPSHRDGVIHPTRAHAEADSEQLDGKTTE